jgi:HK97 family phage major capsid protein
MSILEKKQQQLKKAEELLGRYDSAGSLNQRQQEMRDDLASEIRELRAELAGPGPGALTLQGGRRIESPGSGFRSFGEQLQAIRSAGIPGGRRDERLDNILAAASGLNETVPSDGSFLVQQDYSNELLKQLFLTGILANRCRRIQISSSSNSIKINAFDETSRASTRFGGILGYWKGEADELTASKPKFRQLNLILKKLIGLCYATDELVEDAPALAQVIGDAFVSEFGFLIDDGIINGTGTGQMLGILNSGCLVTVNKQSGQKAATVVTENILDMYSRLLPGSDATACWLINRNILPQLYAMSLSVGTGGVPIFMPANSVAGQPFNTLLGCPIVVIEQAATLGTVGDIILADLPGGYILAEKGGIQAESSIHVRFVYDELVYRFTMRLDGSPVLASPITAYKGGQTLSHFVALQTRS